MGLFGNFGMFPGSVATGFMEGQNNAQRMQAARQAMALQTLQQTQQQRAMQEEQRKLADDARIRSFGGQTLYGLLDQFDHQDRAPAPMPGTPSEPAHTSQQTRTPQPLGDRGYGYGLAQIPLANAPIPGVPLSGPASGLPAYMDPALRQVMPGAGDPSQAPSIGGVPLYRPAPAPGGPPAPSSGGAGMAEAPVVPVTATVAAKVMQDPMLIQFLRAARAANVPAELLPDMIAKFNPIMANEIRDVQAQSLASSRERQAGAAEYRAETGGLENTRKQDQGDKRLQFLREKWGGQQAIEREKNRIRALAVGSPMSQKELEFLFDAYRAGSNVVPILGRSQVRRDQFSAYAASQGESGADVSADRMGAAAESSGQRALSVTSARQGVAFGMMEKTLPLLLAASAKVSRTQLKDFNNILMAGEKRTGDQNVVQLGVYLNTLINQYSRAVSPSGTPTVADKEHAREILESGFSEGQLRSAVEALMAEVKAESTTVPEVQAKRRKAFVSGQSTSGSASPDASKPPTKGEIRSGYRFKGGNPADAANWEQVR